MVIEHPIESRVVEEWEIHLQNKEVVPLIIDPEAGDTAEFNPNSSIAYFSIQERPAPFNPDTMLPPEEVFIPIASIAYMVKRLRIVEEPSPEEKENIQLLLQELAGLPADMKH